MSNTIPSPNMNLPVPVVGVEVGPQWASDNNNCLGIVDGHNHSPGSGVQINPNGININSDLSFSINNATLLKSTRFYPLLSALSGASDIGCLYEVGADLYYNDGNGNQIRITQSGSVSGSAGTITGLPSGTASASFSAVSGTFILEQATGVGGNLDIGSLIIRYPGSYPTPSGNYISIEAPTSLSSGYSITLPAVAPSSSGALLTEDTGGNLSYTNVDGSTIQNSSGVLSIPSSVSLPGTPSASGKNIVVSGANLSSSMMTYRGTVGALGNVAVGEGFTSVLSGTAEYTVTFNTPFSAQPIIIATPNNTNAAFYAVVFTSGSSSFTVLTFNSSGTALAVQFNFIAIGPS